MMLKLGWACGSLVRVMINRRGKKRASGEIGEVIGRFMCLLLGWVVRY